MRAPSSLAQQRWWAVPGVNERERAHKRRKAREISLLIRVAHNGWLATAPLSLARSHFQHSVPIHHQSHEAERLPNARRSIYVAHLPEAPDGSRNLVFTVLTVPANCDDLLVAHALWEVVTPLSPPNERHER
jgi:hypothetical protein